MRVEVRAAYVSGSQWTRQGRTGSHRYVSFEAEVPFAAEEDAPVVLALQAGGFAEEYRAYGGRLFGNPARRFVERADQPPLLTAIPRASERDDDPLPESPEDAAAGGADRDFAVRVARGLSDGALTLLCRDQEGVLVDLRPLAEPLIAVIPPGYAARSRLLLPAYGANKLPGLRPVLNFDPSTTMKDDPDFLALLREDRIFLVDEMAEATDRAREYGDRVNNGAGRIEVRDASCLTLDLSTMALRLTAREAVGAIRRRRVTPEVAVARSTLAAVVADKGANAAAICPHARSFLTAFRAGREMLKLSEGERLAPFLDRLNRAHERAQKRMAANRIPDRDMRALAPEDDLALGRLSL